MSVIVKAVSGYRKDYKMLAAYNRQAIINAQLFDCTGRICDEQETRKMTESIKNKALVESCT